jgi:hypothetical protein
LYLVLLNPRFIKTDQTFVRPHHESTHDESLLEIIISLGNQLEMIMLAGGIETRGQLERLRVPGCQLGQGFLFSEAVAVAKLPAIMHRVPPVVGKTQPADVTAGRVLRRVWSLDVVATATVLADGINCWASRWPAWKISDGIWSGVPVRTAACPRSTELDKRSKWPRNCSKFLIRQCQQLDYISKRCAP